MEHRNGAGDFNDVGIVCGVCELGLVYRTRAYTTVKSQIERVAKKLDEKKADAGRVAKVASSKKGASSSSKQDRVVKKLKKGAQEGKDGNAGAPV